MAVTGITAARAALATRPDGVLESLADKTWKELRAW